MRAAFFMVEEDDYYMHQTTLREIRYKFGLHAYFESEEVGQDYVIYHRKYERRGGTTIFIRVDEADSDCVRIRFYFSKNQKVKSRIFEIIDLSIILTMFLNSFSFSILFLLMYIATFPFSYHNYTKQRNRFLEDIPGRKPQFNPTDRHAP